MFQKSKNKEIMYECVTCKNKFNILELTNHKNGFKTCPVCAGIRFYILDE